jgi:hypothetical protein
MAVPTLESTPCTATLARIAVIPANNAESDAQINVPPSNGYAPFELNRNFLPQSFPLT